MCLASAACGSDPVTSTTGSVEDPSADQGGVVDGKHLGPRLNPAKAWTGADVFVFGGRSVIFDDGGLLNDGALLDPADLTITRTLPAPPFERPLGAPTAAVSQPGQVLVLGSPCNLTTEELLCAPPITQQAAIYDSREDSWRLLDLPEEIQAAPGAVVVGVTGAGLVVVEAGRTPGQFWTYDGGHDTWTPVEAAPLGKPAEPFPEGSWLSTVIDRCVAGDSIVAIESVEPLLPGSSEGPRGVRTLIHSVGAGGGWTTETDPDITLDFTPTLRCTDESVVLIPRLGPQLGLWQMNLVGNRSWTQVPAASEQVDAERLPSSFLSQAVWNEQVVFVGSAAESSLLFNPTDGVWTLGPESPGTADLNPLATDVGLVSEGAGDPPGAGTLFTIPVG